MHFYALTIDQFHSESVATYSFGFHYSTTENGMRFEVYDK